MKRAHTTANIAPAILKLRAQINTAYPHRDKSSDGIWPSAAHSAANPSSDHEAGNALDIDNDLAAGVDVGVISIALAVSRDARLKYIIHDGRIWDAAHGWHAYSGSNPHKTHMHVSVREDRRNLTAPWVIARPSTATVMCSKTHGAHWLPSWVSPTRGKFTAGKRYRTTPGCVGDWRKLLTDDGRQAWGFAPYFK